MHKIVECVPNFSEGSDQVILDKIADAIKSVEGAKLLDVDPGSATNRTVFTLVGSPEVVVEAAFQGIKMSYELIDMSKHSGEHPRMGATDVCPFVPVSNVTMEECAELARELGARVGKELNLPVYLYENAASSEERRNLANIRQGEYEGLKARFEGKDKKWTPDFGPAEFNEKFGCVAIGAREFLIAYNINLNSKEKKHAHDIALDIREKGRAKRDDKGEIIRDDKGKALKKPGVFKNVKGIGWVIPEYGRAQISMNLTNYKVASPHEVMEEVRSQALKRGLVVTGSEIVGLLPLDVMIRAGEFYLKKANRSQGTPQHEVIECAIQSLGLNDISEFDPKKRIVEFAMDDRDDRLMDMTAKGFVNELSSDSKAPGGGSVAALDASLAAGLTQMVVNLTVGKKGYEEHFDALNKVGPKASALKEYFIRAVDDDTDSFNGVMAASRAPKAERKEKVEEATKKATLVPFSVLEKLPEVLELADVLVEKGNSNSLSDVGVAALTARSGATGAFMNVVINLAGIEDKGFVKEYLDKAKRINDKVQKKSDQITNKIIERLESELDG
jgi:glutamate formiminotransferase/formiminotetrahydrofolate cyclodeaminase